ncbi:MAG: hypothetical protein PHR25_06625 [Clostridia bacterium]|nr:hypothetical protein [Tissierellia bacterium]MDD4376429.1 hypothetical protein [Clostridia bacterium]
MKSNINDILNVFFNDTIINIAKEMGYSEENLLILESEEEKLKVKYPKTYQNLTSCNHNRDHRSFMKYGQDLICSWIFEDYFLYNMKILNIDIEFSGNDFERKILENSKVDSNPDYKLLLNNKKISIELVNDYTGYWQKTKKCDLRDDKYRKMMTKQDIDYSFIIGIDLINKSFFLFDVKNNSNNVTYSSFHFYYNKPAYTISLDNIKFSKFSFDNILSEIIKNTEE